MRMYNVRKEASMSSQQSPVMVPFGKDLGEFPKPEGVYPPPEDGGPSPWNDDRDQAPISASSLLQ